VQTGGQTGRQVLLSATIRRQGNDGAGSVRYPLAFPPWFAEPGAAFSTPARFDRFRVLNVSIPYWDVKDRNRRPPALQLIVRSEQQALFQVVLLLANQLASQNGSEFVVCKDVAGDAVQVQGSPGMLIAFFPILGTV